MDYKPPALGSAQIADEINQLETVRQQLLASELISTTVGGDISTKTTIIDVFGERVEALLLLPASGDKPLIARLMALRNIAESDHLPESEFQRELQASLLTANSSIPGDSALLHACLPFQTVILLTHPNILAISCSNDWQQQVQAVFGKQTAVVEHIVPSSALRQTAAKAARDANAQALFLRYIGLIIGANSLAQAAQAAAEIATKIGQKTVNSLSAIPLEPPIRVELAQRRLELCRSLGSLQLVRQAGSLPANVTPEILSAPGEPSAVHSRAFHPLEADPALGLLVYASSAAELEDQTRLLLAGLQIRTAAAAHGPCQLLPSESKSASQSVEVFGGEIALVTGAATGIGRAAVASLLERGAAVAAMDIKPEITNLFDSPAYLGFQVDLTCETAVMNCLEQMVRAFGGLDMLVLNAGIFPPSCNLEALSMEQWRKVMQINVDVNITLLRECYPLLKRAPRYGRVVINASRNVPAPGPGAAAYSASKAALVQLGRVAALEWAASGIRVNMLNPHAVFDTGIWTDEVLHSRAAKYGLTVEQYKTNNLLHVELTSHDLGELIAETLGPIFSKTTGAQIPVDGGSDRVI